MSRFYSHCSSSSHINMLNKQLFTFQRSKYDLNYYKQIIKNIKKVYNKVPSYGKYEVSVQQCSIIIVQDNFTIKITLLLLYIL